MALLFLPLGSFYQRLTMTLPMPLLLLVTMPMVSSDVPGHAREGWRRFSSLHFSDFAEIE
jgi:hypothetical protein